MILTPEARAAFDLSTESEKTKDAYGRGSFGQSLLLTRRLIEAGSRFVTAAGHELNGWDTHSDNDQRHKEKMNPDTKKKFNLSGSYCHFVGDHGQKQKISLNAGIPLILLNFQEDAKSP